MKPSSYIIPFSDIDTLDQENIGKEGKKIGELAYEKFPIPDGFIISSHAYMSFLITNKLDTKIKRLLTTLHYNYPETIIQIANHINKMILEAPFEETFYNELKKSYKNLNCPTVSLKAYSHTKDFPLHTKQNAESLDEMVLRIKDVWAAHFSAYLLHKRHEEHAHQIKTGSTIIVQSIPQVTKKGKIITIDPMDHAKNKLLITHKTSTGTDSYIISKKNLSILERHFQNHTIGTRALTLGEIWVIAKLGKKLEQHTFFPQEITWGIVDGKLLLLNTKPYTQLPKGKKTKTKKQAIARGYSLTNLVRTGNVKLIRNKSDFQNLKANDIIVVKEILPNYIPLITKARGIIAEKGEKHSPVTTSLRQKGIPTLYDVKFATKVLKNGQIITIHGGKGEIYNGGIL